MKVSLTVGGKSFKFVSDTGFCDTFLFLVVVIPVERNGFNQF